MRATDAREPARIAGFRRARIRLGVGAASLVCALKQDGKVHRETQLTPDAGAGTVLAGNKSETESEATSDIVLAAQHALQLAAAQSVVIGDAPIELRPDSPASVEVVKQGDAARVHVSARGFDADDPGAGVTRENGADVDVEARGSGKRLLDHEVEPIVGKPGAKLLLAVAGGKFDVQRGAEGRDMG